MHRFEKSLRVSLVLLILYSNTNFRRVSAANAVQLAGFENENILMDLSAWELGIRYF